MQLNNLVQGGSLPDDAKMVLQEVKIPEVRPPPPMPPPISGGGPPPPPPPGPPPAPACPLSGPTKPLMNHVTIKKDVPKPSNPLKSFNWSKLPDVGLDLFNLIGNDHCRVKLTLKCCRTNWKELYGQKWMMPSYTESWTWKILIAPFQLTRSIRLKISLKFDFCFILAFSENLCFYIIYWFNQNDGSMEDLRFVGKARNREFSVIDGRRAQNCTILLSKLKMTNEEICKAILSMDNKDKLPKDMIEQVTYSITTFITREFKRYLTIVTSLFI